MNRRQYKDLSAPEKFAVVALAADRIVEERAVVFTYFGPADLRRDAAAWSKKGLDAIIEELGRIGESEINSVENHPPVFRHSYLKSQINSLISSLGLRDLRPSGEKLSKAVRGILGLEPPQPYDLVSMRRDETETFNRYGFEDYADYKKRGRIALPANITNAFLRKWYAKLADSFIRDFTPHMFNGEALANVIRLSKVRMERAKENYPPDYFIYRGRHRGTMCIGDGFRKTGFLALRAIMHELCPGHHIYYLYRETMCEAGLLGPEAAVDLLYSAETPVSEGVAETALYYIESLDHDLLNRAKAAAARDRFCKKILYNIWHQRFVTGRMSERESREYLIEEGGFEDTNTTTWLSFIDNWRVYFPAYPVGTDKIKARLTGIRARDLEHLYLPRAICD